MKPLPIVETRSPEELERDEQGPPACPICHYYFDWDPKDSVWKPRCRCVAPREDAAKADRRAFRRQVVLALIQSPTVTVANVFQQKDLWAIADLIVAAEPPEPEEPTRNEQKQRVDGFAETDEET